MEIYDVFSIKEKIILQFRKTQLFTFYIYNSQNKSYLKIKQKPPNPKNCTKKIIN